MRHDGPIAHGPREPVERPAEPRPVDPVSADGGRARPRAARRATSGSTSRSGTASAASSRTAPASCGSGRATRGRCSATSPSSARSRSCFPPLSALDGEIVIERDGVLDFDAMQMRLHPAESRVNKLSAEIPARFIAFDVLVWKGVEAWREPLVEAPDARSSAARSASSSRPRRAIATRRSAGSTRFEAIGLDGVIAKRRDRPYLPGSRDGSREGEAREDG